MASGDAFVFQMSRAGLVAGFAERVWKGQRKDEVDSSLYPDSVSRSRVALLNDAGLQRVIDDS